MYETYGLTTYSPQQVAELLGYKVNSVYALLSRKELLASRVGRRRLISQEQLNAFLNKRKNGEFVIDYTK